VCVSGPAPLLGCRPIRVRVESLYILYSIYYQYNNPLHSTHLSPWIPSISLSTRPALIVNMENFMVFLVVRELLCLYVINRHFGTIKHELFTP
jgi:hypothetical protein